MIPPVTSKKMINANAILYDLSSDIQAEASTLIVRGEYIKNISQAFNKDFQDRVEQTINRQKEYNSRNRSIQT